jgi:hypothetical protein
VRTRGLCTTSACKSQQFTQQTALEPQPRPPPWAKVGLPRGPAAGEPTVPGFRDTGRWRSGGHGHGPGCAAPETPDPPGGHRIYSAAPPAAVPTGPLFPRVHSTCARQGRNLPRKPGNGSRRPAGHPTSLKGNGALPGVGGDAGTQAARARVLTRTRARSTHSARARSAHTLTRTRAGALLSPIWGKGTARLWGPRVAALGQEWAEGRGVAWQPAGARWGPGLPW